MTTPGAGASELVERLEAIGEEEMYHAPASTLDEAAAEIRRLSGLVERAREALRPFAKADVDEQQKAFRMGCKDGNSKVPIARESLRRARATLAEMDED